MPMTTTTMRAAMPTPTWTQTLSESAGVPSLFITELVGDTDTVDSDDVNCVGLYAPLNNVVNGNHVLTGVGSRRVVDVDWVNISTNNTHNTTMSSHCSQLLSSHTINTSLSTSLLTSIKITIICLECILPFPVQFLGRIILLPQKNQIWFKVHHATLQFISRVSGLTMN